MSIGVIRGYRYLAAATFAVSAFLLAGGGAGVAQSSTELKLTLDGRIEGPAAPYLVAQDRGHFAAEGLEVTVEPSAGGVEPITRVASGQFDIGVVDINAFIRYRDQNPAVPVKVVFVVSNRPGYAIIGRKSRGVSSPDDLADKRLGAPAAENASAVWPTFAKLNGVDPAKVRVVNVGVPVREPMLAAVEIDAATGSSFSSPIALREKGVPAEDITTMVMGRFGLALYGTSIIVNARVLQERPEAVRAFLRALLVALKETVNDPAAAIAAVTPRMNGGNADIELERLKVAIRDTIATRAVRANGLGDIDPERFATGIDQLAVSYNFKSRPKLADVFDPSFLPPEDARRIN
jgi:NitT/TauT family transport system substrate-binding protein